MVRRWLGALIWLLPLMVVASPEAEAAANTRRAPVRKKKKKPVKVVPPAPPKPLIFVEMSFDCVTQTKDGKTVHLPEAGILLSAPIRCVVDAGPDTGEAKLKGTVRTVVDGFARASHDSAMVGVGNGLMQQDLVAGEDFDNCSDFSIEAEIREAGGKLLAKRQIKVLPRCAD